MELNEISELIEQDGGKFIIVEEGRPSLVIMDFDEYRKKISNQVKSNPERIPEEIPPESPQDLGTEEVNIEDLPLE